MKERYAVGGRIVEVDAAASRAEVSARRAADGTVQVARGGETWTAVVAGEEVVIGGRTRRVRKAPPAAAAPPPVVTPPMPSVVTRLLVAVGEVVAAGQGLVTVTAMKMEVTLRAPHAGTVAEVRVAPGDKVMPGQVLVEVTP